MYNKNVKPEVDPCNVQIFWKHLIMELKPKYEVATVCWKWDLNRERGSVQKFERRRSKQYEIEEEEEEEEKNESKL